MDDQNLRRAQRYDLQVPVEYTVGTETKSTTSRNMSLGGLFLQAEEKVALGVRLTVRFKVPTQKEPIEVGAIVRWTDSVGFGVQFDGLRARDVWALGKFFEQPQS